MLRIKKLVKKELIDIFSAPMIYVLAALFCFIMGWLFFNYLVSSKELSSVNIKDSVIVPIFGNMNFIFIFLSPLLTMRVFAEEKKQFTLDLLLISKLSETEIIIGKFISVFVSALF